MTRAQAAIALVVVLAAGGLAAFTGPTVAVVEATRDAATKVGPSFPRHERISCVSGSTTEIKPSGGFQLVSYECTAKGAVVVGSTTGAGAALTTANGVEYVDGDRFGANVQRAEACITTAGTTVLQCRFLVTQW
jgi:hypothetical protein